jgi:DNA-3-methyladenine glycosylase
MSAGPGGRAFPRDQLAGDTLETARAMLGARLVRDPAVAGGMPRVGRIVEVEAYLGPDDRASHARMGPTSRNRVMFGPAGIVEPLEGADAMRAGRARPGIPDARLAAGPGLVGASFGVTLADTGRDLVDPASPLRLEARPAGEPAPLVATGPRVGIAYAGQPWTSRPWRFAIIGSPALSRRIG